VPAVRLRPLIAATPVLAASSLATPGVARAVEKESAIAVAGGPSVLVIDDKSTASTGAGGALHFTQGLTDQFNFVAEASSSIVALNAKLDNPDTPHTRPAGVETLGVGGTYVLDILRWVPYAGVLGSATWLHGGTMESGGKVAAGIQLALGLDYKFNFSWSVGLAYRQHLLATEMSTYPSFSQVFLRVQYSWGR
jgi:hypothetical protein